MVGDGEGGLTQEQKAKAWDNLGDMIEKMRTHERPDGKDLKPVADGVKLMMATCEFLASTFK
jgi:hypothetical protein